MTTLEEFRSTIKDIHEKLANQNNTLQKNQTLWQYIKEYCARTLEQRNLDDTFEGEIKKELMNAQKQLGDLKKSIGTNNSMGSNVSFGQSSYQSPSTSSSPVGQSDLLSSVPTTPFDPNSSPILRRLAQGKSIHESRFKSSDNKIDDGSNTSQPTSDGGQNSSPESNLESIPESIPESSPEPLKTGPEIPSAPDQSIFSQFPHSPFPVQSETKLESFTAYLEIPQLNGRIDLSSDALIHRIGRKDIMQASKIQVNEDFYNSIIDRLDKESVDSPSEHFLIEQSIPGEFWIKDTGNLQKTYFKNAFVDMKGMKIQDGDQFILPVNINNQLASLTVKFNIKK